MAGVFVDQIVGLRLPDITPAPGCGPDGVIGHGEVVIDVAVFHQREPLNHLEIFIRTGQAAVLTEAFGLNHQRVAVPVADGVTEPFPICIGGVFRIEPDDGRIVDHFLQDHHVRLGLHDSLVVVVQTGNGRHGGAEGDQTAL